MLHNLLTNEQKEKNKRQYNLRRLIVVSISLCFLGLVAIILLVPSYVYILTEESNTTREVDAIRDNGADSLKPELNKYVDGVSDRLSAISGKEDYVASIYIEKIIAEKGVGIKLSGFLFEDMEKTFMTINGVASSRDDLVRFKRTLEALKLFESLDLPVSNLAMERDITFTLKGALLMP